MKEYGYVRVATFMPKLTLMDVSSNKKEIIKGINKAYREGASIILTPELSLTGYTCGDLFLNEKIINDSYHALLEIVDETTNLDIISIIGLPIRYDNMLFNAAAVISRGKILGIAVKTYIPNYNEFYEKRWFSSSKDLYTDTIKINDCDIPIGNNLVFVDKDNSDMSFGIEICEDLWGVIPISSKLAMGGSSIIFNLSSSNEVIGKYEYRKNLVKMQSSKTISAYVYLSSGVMESTSDIVFSGSSMVYENGHLLKENKRFDFNSNMTIADIDTSILINERIRNKTFMDKEYVSNILKIEVSINNRNKNITRVYKKYPFVPSTKSKRDERCKEIISIMSNALGRRIVQLKDIKCVIGISGGLDSTLAFLVTVSACKKIGKDLKDIICVTMPGFGTTDRTYNNALKLVSEYGASLREVSIKKSCIQHFKDIGISEDDRGVAYENAQARERTQILMDIANKENGIVIGTGDMSEMALGWCTYNGDHMSMYAVNSSIPKTLVRYLVEYFKDRDKSVILKDIIDTPISPELLPPNKNGEILQKTESNIGHYVLHDFFLYYFLRYGMSPKKIFLLASITFYDDYNDEEIKKWLRVFFNRFFNNQFKRNCFPDGIKVGNVSLSPRGDFRMPGDAVVKSFIKEIDSL